MSERSKNESVRVIVAEDQKVTREGLVALLDLLEDIEVVADASDGEQALRLLEENDCDVVLMDLRMPVMDGIEATRRVIREHPGVAVLILTTYDDDESIVTALQAGARGYLTKDAGRIEISSALRSVASGQSTFDANVSRRLIDTLSSLSPEEARGTRTDNPDGLTNREVEVLRLISHGLSNQAIASSLYLAESTVKSHINNAFAKIEARNRADAVRYVYRKGLSDEIT